MSDISKQQQAAVAAHQSIQQQQPASQQAQMQQQVESQTIQVQQVQISHDGNDQMHPQGSQVASSSSGMNQTSTMVMAASQQALIPQQAMQNMQSPIQSQASSTTITTMSTGPPQQMAEWPGHGRVQVIQQPIQNPTYIQPVYNAQGQLIVPGNIALHPGNMNQPIQVITAGKAFQPSQVPHMLATTPGKPIVQNQTTSFPGYTTIPTSGNNQTLVISQLGVLGQTNILSQQQGKPQEMQKMITKTNVNNNNNIKASPTQQQNVSIGNLVSSQPQGITSQAQAIIQPQIINPIQYTCNTQQQRTVPQGATQAMQFAPWQATFGATGLPQGLTWAPGTIQSSGLLAQGSQIFIRNPQPEQTGMFIHNAQAPAVPQSNQVTGQQINKQNQTMEMGGNVQSKTAISKTFSTILPNSVSPHQVRAATGVSTQTGQTQTTIHQNNFQSMKTGAKVRTKNVCRMPSVITTQKTDAANQTKAPTSIQVLQPKLVVSNVVPGTPGSASQDNKAVKQTQSPNMQGGNQQQQAQQPLTQIQQMQSIFQEQMDQKPQPGQIMVSNGIANSGDRTLMPVVSMPPGQVTPIMGNMIVQTVSGITTMAPGISIPTGQSVQGVPELMATPNALPAVATIKQENQDQKGSQVQLNGGIDSGPGRPRDERRSRSRSKSTSPAVAAEMSEAKPNKQTNKADNVKVKSDENKENKQVEKKSNDKELPALGHPKATMMVKPQVLTHVIDGFVIQESSEPFPVTRGCMDGWIRKMPPGDNTENGEPPKKKHSVEKSEKEKEMATCETCGKKDLKSKFKKSKRFCSLSCSKRYAREGKDLKKSVGTLGRSFSRFNVGCSSRIGLFSREENKLNSGGETGTSESTGENPLSNAPEKAENSNPANQENENKVNPLQWTVAEVCEFIRNLPGCADYVEDFALQDIDGEALMLLKPDHLMSVMSMKLGPAVKIIAKIDTMRNGETNPAT